MRHTISIIVANQPGELSRIVGLFSARGFNIETISVGKTLEPNLSKATVVTHGDERTIEQIVKRCSAFARVREVKAVTSEPHIEREMALIDVSVRSGDERQEIVSLVEIFRAKVVDISHYKNNPRALRHDGQGRYLHRHAQAANRQRSHTKRLRSDQPPVAANVR